MIVCSMYTYRYMTLKTHIIIFLEVPYEVESVLKLLVMVESSIETQCLWILLWVT